MFFFISEIKAWWAKVEFSLAKRVTSESDLRNLGTNGFEVDKDIIDAALTDNPKSINAAATEVIKQWGVEQIDKEKAYDDLCRILGIIEKKAWITELPEKFES